MMRVFVALLFVGLLQAALPVSAATVTVEVGSDQDTLHSSDFTWDGSGRSEIAVDFVFRTAEGATTGDARYDPQRGTFRLASDVAFDDKAYAGASFADTLTFSGLDEETPLRISFFLRAAASNQKARVSGFVSSGDGAVSDGFELTEASRDVVLRLAFTVSPDEPAVSLFGNFSASVDTEMFALPPSAIRSGEATLHLTGTLLEGLPEGASFEAEGLLAAREAVVVPLPAAWLLFAGGGAVFAGRRFSRTGPW